MHGGQERLQYPEFIYVWVFVTMEPYLADRNVCFRTRACFRKCFTYLLTSGSPTIPSCTSRTRDEEQPLNGDRMSKSLLSDTIWIQNSFVSWLCSALMVPSACKLTVLQTPRGREGLRVGCRFPVWSCDYSHPWHDFTRRLNTVVNQVGPPRRGFWQHREAISKEAITKTHYFQIDLIKKKNGYVKIQRCSFIWSTAWCHTLAVWGVLVSNSLGGVAHGTLYFLLESLDERWSLVAHGTERNFGENMQRRLGPSSVHARFAITTPSNLYSRTPPLPGWGGGMWKRRREQVLPVAADRKQEERSFFLSFHQLIYLQWYHFQMCIEGWAYHSGNCSLGGKCQHGATIWDIESPSADYLKWCRFEIHF